MIYYDLGLIEESQKMFQAAKEGPLESAGFEDKQTKIRVLISLASLYLGQAIRDHVKERREELFNEVKKNIHISDKIEVNEKATFVLKGKRTGLCRG